MTAHLSGLHSAIKMLCGKLAVIKEYMDRIAAGWCTCTLSSCTNIPAARP